MNIKSYKIVVPISQTECLEIIPKRYADSATLPSNFLPDFKVFVTNTEVAGGYSEISTAQHLHQHNEIKCLLKVVHQSLSKYSDKDETFMISSSGGFQMVRSNQILYFEYSNPKKQWVTVLTDLTCYLLKRNTAASSILEYSDTFIRINQQYIVNLNHLERIEDKECILTIQNQNAHLIISRSYIKSLQEKIRVI